MFVTYRQTREGNSEALRLDKIAISLDPGFARAHGFTLQVVLGRRRHGDGSPMPLKTEWKLKSLPNKRYSSTRMTL